MILCNVCTVLPSYTASRATRPQCRDNTFHSTRRHVPQDHSVAITLSRFPAASFRCSSLTFQLSCLFPSSGSNNLFLCSFCTACSKQKTHARDRLFLPTRVFQLKNRWADFDEVWCYTSYRGNVSKKRISRRHVNKK